MLLFKLKLVKVNSVAITKIEVTQLSETDSIEHLEEEANEVRSSFWVCSDSHFATTLYIAPCQANAQANLGQFSVLSFYDSDGNLFNKARSKFSSTHVGALELDMFMGSCKLESGLRHAQLVVQSPVGTKHFSSIATGGRVLISGDPQIITAEHQEFVPLLLSEDRVAFVVLMNQSVEEQLVKCRMFIGSRTPDSEITIPAMGVRILDLNAEFGDFVEAGERRQAYLRFSVSGGSGSVGAQLYERSVNEQQHQYYSSVG